MKLVLAVINNTDARETAAALTKAGYPATVTDSYGGFLGKKNSILLSGVEDRRVDAVIEIIRETTRDEQVEVTAAENGAAQYRLPPHVKVGGAAVFLLDVDRFVLL